MPQSSSGPNPFKSVLFADSEGEEAGLIHQTQYTQPALFAVELALARLWQSWGVHPDYLLGHSIGEWSAAAFAGVFTLEDAARLVCARGRLMQACQDDGWMASIQATEAEFQEFARDVDAAVDIAAFNEPSQLTISGDASAVQAVMEKVEAAGKKARRLQVSHAFHSAHMEPMLQEFEDLVAACSLHAPAIPMASNQRGSSLPMKNCAQLLIGLSRFETP